MQPHEDQPRQVMTVLAVVIVMTLIATTAYISIRIYTQRTSHARTMQNREDLGLFADKLNRHYAASNKYPTTKQLSLLQLSPSRTSYTYFTAADTGDNCDNQKVVCSYVLITTNDSKMDEGIVVVNKEGRRIR